ncbi:hypothetical protein AUR64_02470 [Haloprofundus marisrubri]|uniref:TIGR00341 family protein n=1 Tax=Haloprofundus marisrubri TaxID=1514971 RepID=A0A0W1R302_9EURY|nr:hypothetical protein AUR64_02470 [Haloprofundus marisrubri]
MQLTIPTDSREAVVGILDARELAFTMTQEVSQREYDLVISVPVETDAVEDLLDAFRSVGVERNGFAVISDVEAVLSDELTDEKEDEPNKQNERLIQTDRISRDELRAQAAEMAAVTPNYVIFTVISAVVAGAGLLADSAAVVVGSMVIAPLLGPAVGASVGSIVNDDDLFRTGVKAQLLGLGLAVFSATLFAFAAKYTVMPNTDIRSLSEVAARVNPGALSLVVALGSGAAGALSLSAGASAPLVGVMIAAALIPPAAAVGLGVAYADSVLVISAGILVLVNVLSINFASLGVLWVRGYRPDHWFEQETARRITLQRIGVLVVGIAVLSSFLVVTTIDVQENAQFESSVEQAAAESELQVLSTTVEYETELFSRTPRLVVVQAVADDGAADQLRERIQARTALDVPVVIVREDVERSGTEAPALDRSRLDSVQPPHDYRRLPAAPRQHRPPSVGGFAI